MIQENLDYAGTYIKSSEHNIEAYIQIKNFSADDSIISQTKTKLKSDTRESWLCGNIYKIVWA